MTPHEPAVGRSPGAARRRGDWTLRVHPDLIGQLAHAIWIANRELQRVVREELVGADCPLKWIDVVVLTVVCSPTNVGVTQQYIGERTGLDRSTVSALLADLEYDGYIARRTAPGDRRALVVEPTESGVSILGQAQTVMQRVERKAMARMGSRQIEHLFALLGKLRPHRSRSIFGDMFG